MSETILISFQNNDGAWQEVMTVGLDALSMENDDRGWMNFRINTYLVATKGPLREMSGPRLWRFVWLQEGRQIRPPMELRMSLQPREQRGFSLRTV